MGKHETTVRAEPAEAPRGRRRSPQPAPQSPTAPATCRRCSKPGPVGDDGFCEKCEKALEQACL